MSNTSIQKGTKAYQLIVDEKGFGGHLSTLGKLAYFKEYFDNEQLEEEIIKIIAPIENPKEQKSFKSGYEMAIALVNGGFGKKEYADFLKNMNKTLKEKLELKEQNIKKRG